MIKAIASKQLTVDVKNKVGTLAEINSIIASSGINMVAISAYKVKDKCVISFVSENNAYAKRRLKAGGFSVDTEDVVLLSVSNEPGALRSVTDKISEAGIDLTLMYGSVEKLGKTSRIVLVSENNKATLKAIRGR